MVLSGRDLPDGNFKELERSGAKQKSNSRVVLKARRRTLNPEPNPALNSLGAAAPTHPLPCAC